MKNDEKNDSSASLLPGDALASPPTTEALPNSDREQLKNLLRSNGWRPIIVSAAPGEPVVAAAAWLYEPSCGVRLGSFGRFSDGVAFGSVSGMSGCFVRDWGATHWMPAILPEPPGQIGSGNQATNAEPSDRTRRSEAPNSNSHNGGIPQ